MLRDGLPLICLMPARTPRLAACLADDQPLRRFVMRSSSFSKEDFEKLLEHQGLFNGEGRRVGRQQAGEVVVVGDVDE